MCAGYFSICFASSHICDIISMIILLSNMNFKKKLKLSFNLSYVLRFESEIFRKVYLRICCSVFNITPEYSHNLKEKRDFRFGRHFEWSCSLVSYKSVSDLDFSWINLLYFYFFGALRLFLHFIN